MKALRGTLTFVLGIVIGIILFVLAIGGTIYAVGKVVTIGDLQNKIGVEIVDKNSEAYNKSLIDTIKSIVSDAKDLDKLSLQTLKDKYGIPIPSTVAGINISKAFQYPISEIPNHVDDIVNSITLNEVGTAAGINFTELNLPILNDNLNVGIIDATNNILGSINDDTSIRDINTNFGIDIGASENKILYLLQDAPLSEIGTLINYLKLNDLLEADTDTFVKQSSQIYIKVDLFEEVSKETLKDASYSPALGIETFISGSKDSDNDGTDDALQKKELRFKKQNDKYIVDNSCYNADFDADTTDKKYYRHIEYKLYNGENGIDYYIPSYANAYDNSTDDFYFKGFVKAETTSIAIVGTPSPSKTIATQPKLPNTYYDYIGSLNKNSKLESVTSFGRYVLLSEGTASTSVKSISYKSIEEIQNDTSFIDNLKLGELLTIDETSSKILIALQFTALINLSAAIDDLFLDDIMDITLDTYTEDSNGKYVKIPVGDSYYYTLYNPAYHTSSTYVRYNKTANPNASSKVLQRLRTAKISTFSDSFKDLVLSDVIDITPATYEKVSYNDPSELSADTSYYYYDSSQGLYRLADDTYKSTHNYVYKVSSLGSGSKIIQKLAYVKIDNLSTAMQTVMDEMFISDVVDVIDAYAVEKISGGYSSDDDSFLIKATDIENGEEITYVYDSYGKYMKRGYKFVEVDASSLTKNGTLLVDFHSVSTLSPIDLATNAKDNKLFYQKNSESYMEYIPQLASYLVLQNNTSKLYYATIGSGATYNKYSNTDGNLYVLILGNYVPYDPNEPTHAVQTKYYIKTTVTDGCYININDPIPSDDPIYKFDKTKDQKFSKVYCETIYVKAAGGDYVLFDNEYVLYDNTNAAHANLDRYEKQTGYIATAKQTFYYDSTSSSYKSVLEYQKVNVLLEKSASILIMLKNSKTTLKDMNNVIDGAKLKDLVACDPDSIFAVPFEDADGNSISLKDTSLNNFSSSIVLLMNSFKLGLFLDVANITTVDPTVRQTIKDISLPDFFRSLTYKPGTGIIVDLEAVYNNSSV